MPLHADIVVRCRKLGFDNLNPIIWHKISNARFEAKTDAKFLGKPYEPNAIIKNDMEFILMQRKPGGYRQPTDRQRRLSLIDKEDFDVGSSRSGSFLAPPPSSIRLLSFEFADRLVRMFSFVGDTVLDPFAGTGTTLLAAAEASRNAIGVEIDPLYHRLAKEG